MHHRSVHTAAETLNNAASLAEQKYKGGTSALPCLQTPLLSSSDGPLSQISPPLLHRWSCLKFPPLRLHKCPAVSNSPSPPSQMAHCPECPLALLQTPSQGYHQMNTPPMPIQFPAPTHPTSCNTSVIPGYPYCLQLHIVFD